VQMPEMGGLEATAVIRDRERQKGDQGDKPGHVRIVAMTAHAMKGDRDRCLAAGMDGYLSKPVDPKALFAAIELGDGEVAAPVHSEARPPSGPGVTFDRAELDRRTGGDSALAAELIRLFLEDCPVRMHAIRDAVGNGNAEGLRSAAHALKGAASYFSATHVLDAAARLENLGKKGRMADAAAVQRRLELEVTRLLADLRNA
jgi:two-component system sensor histidine kinase/response regulator